MLLHHLDRTMSAETARAINAEIVRQGELKAAGKFQKTCGDLSDADNLLVLLEEFGEVVEAIDNRDPENLREEIVQCIACFVQWLQRPASEYIDEIAVDERYLNIKFKLRSLGERARAILDEHQAANRVHPFNPEEVDIGVGVLCGYTCLDCGETERQGNHG